MYGKNHLYDRGSNQCNHCQEVVLKLTEYRTDIKQNKHVII